MPRLVRVGACLAAALARVEDAERASLSRRGLGKGPARSRPSLTRMHIRAAELTDAASLIDLWTAAGLRFRPEHGPGELAAVLARDPDLVLVAEDANGVTAAVPGTFDGRRGC